MNSASTSLLAVITLCAANFVAAPAVFAQTTPAATNDKATTAAPAKPLNLDSSAVAAEMSKEMPTEKPIEVLSVAPNKVDELFKKAEKRDAIPTTVEISTPGSPQRVTKVTGPDGSYCVYSPAVGRTDGIDEIQNGQKTQVRTCPQ